MYKRIFQIIPIFLIQFFFKSLLASDGGIKCMDVFDFIQRDTNRLLIERYSGIQTITNLQAKENHSKERAMLSTSSEVNFKLASDYRTYIGARLYEESIKFLGNTNHVLEIGPGNGAALLEFEKTNDYKKIASVTFIEPSEKAIDSLKDRFPKSLIIPTTLENSIDSLRQNLRFDLLIANFSLHWLAHFDLILKQLTEVVKPQGIFSFSNTDTKRSFWANLDAQVRAKFPACGLFNVTKSHSLSLEQWESLFIQSGYSVLKKIEYIGTAAEFESAEAALADLKQMAGSKYLRLAGKYTAQDIETYVLELLNTHASLNGKINVTASGYSLILRHP